MKKHNHPTWNQIKAARSMLSLRQCDLAQQAQVSIPTVKAAEHPTKEISRACLHSLECALELQGIEFIDTGVQLKEQRA